MYQIHTLETNWQARPVLIINYDPVFFFREIDTSIILNVSFLVDLYPLFPVIQVFLHPPAG